MDHLMRKAREEARSAIYGAVLGLFGQAIKEEDIEISTTRDASNGDLASPVSFRLANLKHGDPADIAGKIAGRIGSLKHFSKVEAANGFVNLMLSQEFYAGCMAEIIEKGGKYGESDEGRGRKAIVEFSSPNIGKPMHIGHIRSTILGDAISRVLRFAGYGVVSSNYLCEAGMQTAKLLLSVQLFGKEKLETEKDLLALYVRIHTEMEKDPELEKRAQELVLSMESGDQPTLKQLARIRDLSTKPFHSNYGLLNVRFDEEVYDSDYVLDGKALVAEAVTKGIAFQDKNNETVAELEKYKLPNLIILRSNGTSLYSTRDLGLAERDYRKYKFDKRIYVTAAEQNLHFQQVFAILKALEKPYSERLKHIGFGLISLEEGKLSTRAGRVLLLEDVINDAIALAREEVVKRQEYAKADADEIARMVGIASLKYSILRLSAERDIKFSMREAVKFDGNTATYLQYTAVRAKNILRKAEAESAKTGGKTRGSYAFNAEEKKLAFILSQFPEVAEHAAKQLSPYIVCEYLSKLALQFSSFYDASPVLKAENADARDARLRMVTATRIVLENGLSLLGIDIPEKM